MTHRPILFLMQVAVSVALLLPCGLALSAPAPALNLIGIGGKHGFINHRGAVVIRPTWMPS